jgi:hypothetical protein
VWKIRGQGQDTGARLGAEQRLIGLALSFVFLLECVEAAKPSIPIGFEGVGDEPIIGIDLEITPSR